MNESQQLVMQVRNLKKYFPVVKGSFLNRTCRMVKAVDDVSFDLYKGECLGLVGESGSGKTTVVRTLLRAYAPTAGTIDFFSAGQRYDIAGMDRKSLKKMRPLMQMIFQDPYSSLNPRMTVQRIVGEPLKVCTSMTKPEIDRRVAEVLEMSGLDPAMGSRYPHAFSGGQRQRVGIARALALGPELVVADEAVSALDVSVQAQILNLLHDLQKKLGLTYIFIAHDFSVIKHSCDRVIVMYCGSVMETGSTKSVMEKPLHPYTEALMSSIPEMNPRKRMNRIALQGEIPDPGNPPPGCKFHTRCPKYRKGLCDVGEQPPLREVSPGRFSACLLEQPHEAQ